MFRTTTLRAIRQYSASAAPVSGGAGAEFIAAREATKAHAGATSDLWRRISFYVCVPGAIVGALWVKKVEDEHAAHLEHIREENGGEMPERPIYSYMSIRNKPFPWGNQSFFFNPKANVFVGEKEE